MPRRMTHEEFEKIVFELEGSSYNIIGKYINSSTHIDMFHVHCEREFKISPVKFIHANQRCPYCHNESIMNKNTFNEMVFKRYGDEYLILDEYVNSSTKIRFKHNIEGCNEIFTKSPNKFLSSGQVCACKLKIKQKERSKENFRKKLFDEVGNEYVLVGDYINANSKVTIRHNIKECMMEFNPVARQIFRNKQRCPFCESIRSKGENAVLKFLQEHQINYNPQHHFKGCKTTRLLSFDFAVFNNDKLKCLVEYDGEQHFEPVNFGGYSKEKAIENFDRNKRNDGIKNEYCKNSNIPLIRIPYWEFDRIEEILHHYLIEPIDDFNGSFLVNQN